MGRGRSLAQRRAQEAQAQGGNCFWCGVVMTPVPEDNHLAATRPLTMVTLDHIYPKGHPRRLTGQEGEKRYVAACLGCNSERGRLNSIEQNRRIAFTKRLAISRPETGTPHAAGGSTWPFSTSPSTAR